MAKQSSSKIRDADRIGIDRRKGLVGGVKKELVRAISLGRTEKSMVIGALGLAELGVVY